jgi:mRNA interferase MazF
MGVVNRFEVYLTALDPTVGSEIRKSRPCLVISPDELNHRISTIVIAPLTTADLPYPTRVPCQFGGRAGFIVLDQIRTVDKSRFIRLLGTISTAEAQAVLEGLARLFAE